MVVIFFSVSFYNLKFSFKVTAVVNAIMRIATKRIVSITYLFGASGTFWGWGVAENVGLGVTVDFSFGKGELVGFKSGLVEFVGCGGTVGKFCL
jgi:hypothetical protein